MGQFTHNGITYEDLGNGKVRVVGYANGGAVPIGGPDPKLPYETRKAQNDALASSSAPAKASADARIAELEAQIKAAQAPNAAAVAQAERDKAIAEAQKAQIEASGGGPKLDPAVRQKAIQQYGYAKQLSDIADNLTKLYLAGPGATKGLEGLKDFLPTEGNKNFDAQANKARGIVGQTLAFTGGQLNTPQESEKGVGPFLPQSDNFDSTIEQKIQALRDLSAAGRATAIQTLGGEPDANGVIRPVGQTPPPANTSTNLPGTETNDPQGFATGKTRAQVDPVLRALGHRVGTMVASGVPDKSIIAYLKGAGVDPAGTSIDTILKYRAGQNIPGVMSFKEWQRKFPGQAYPLGSSFYTKQVPMSDARSLLNKTATTDMGGAALAAPVAAANAISGGYLNDLTADPNMAQTGMDLLRNNHPYASLAGDVAGQATLEGSLGRIPGLQGLLATKLGRRAADVGYGAFSGSGESDDNRGVGAVAGGALGGITGAMGRGAQRALGGAFTGVTNKSLQLLDNSGVPLTIGQIGHGSNSIAGKAIGGIEDRFAGMPGFDAVINNARKRGEVGFNQAIFKQAGGSGATGAAGLDELNGLQNKAYSFLDGANIPLDAQFAGSQAGVRAAVPAMPAYGNELSKGLNLIDNVSKGGAITGRDWQSALRSVRADKASLKGQPFADMATNALGDVDSNLLDLADRQGPPGTLDNLNAANKLHAQIQTIAGALDNGPTQKADQLFTPGRIDDVSRVNARKFGGRMASLTGQNRPFYDLTQAGMEVMPSAVKDSGTAGRMMLVPIATGALGSGLGAASGENDRLGGSETGAKYGALLGLAAMGPYSKAGQKALQKALLADRPDRMVRIGNYLINADPRYAGMFGSSLGRDYFFQPELSQ